MPAAITCRQMGTLGAMCMLCCTRRLQKTGRVALARVVIAQRERTIAIRAMPGGLVTHTLDEQRDINDAQAIFDDATEMKVDPEMVQLAKTINRPPDDNIRSI
jgi:non-homologous end joining protein Ku